MSHARSKTSSPPTRVIGHGSNRVVVCHGWMGDHTLFDPFISRIYPSVFTYAFFDARGYGARIREAGPMTIEGVAEDVLSIADALSWESFHVMGHSMGGMTAQRLMVDAPERLRSAILIAPVPASGAKITEERRKLLLDAIADPAKRRELIDVNTGRKQSAAWLNQVLGLSLGSTSAAGLEAYMRSWTTTDFSAEAKGSPVPVFTIVGELDPGAPLERIQQTIGAWYPHASVTQMANVGHYPMQESAEVLTATVDGCLNAQKGTRNG